MAVGQVAPILTTTTAAVAASNETASLPVGQAIEARVQQILADGLTRLITALGTVDLKVSAPLPVGANVTIEVASETGTVVVTLPRAATAPPTLTPPTLAPPALTPPAPSSPGPDRATPTPVSEPAVIFGGNLASTAATNATAGNPVATLQSAIAEGIASAATPQTPVAPTIVASTPSGVPTLAVTADTSVVRPTAAPLPPASPLFSALASALPIQNSVAPLIAHLVALAERPSGLPPPVLSAADKVIVARLDVEQGVTPAKLVQAIDDAGVFFEKHMALGAEARSLTSDLKAALLNLRDALTAVAQPKIGQTQAAPAPETRPAPPRRGEAPEPQRPLAPAIPSGQGPKGVAHVLLGEANAALARLTLSQIASLPNAQPSQDVIGTPTGSQNAPQALHVEIPVAFGPQTGVLQLTIERDGHHGASVGQAEQHWRVWFALDTPEGGPITALVTMAKSGVSPGVVGVTLWAERPKTNLALKTGLNDLRADLAKADLDVGELATRAGQPKRTIKSSGHFLDTAT